MPQWPKRTRVNQQKLCLKAKTEAVSSAGIHRLTLRRHNTIRKMQVTLSPGIRGDPGVIQAKAVRKEAPWSLRPTRKASVSSRRQANALSDWAVPTYFKPAPSAHSLDAKMLVGKSGSHFTSDALL